MITIEKMNTAAFWDKVTPLIEDFRGKASFCFREITQDATEEREAICFSYREDAIGSIASVGKIFILGTLLEQKALETVKRATERGIDPQDTAFFRDYIQDSLKQRVAYRIEDKVGGSGVIQFLEPGMVWTIGDLALMMTILSDNTATNMVLRYVGGATKVMEHLDRCGIQVSGVNRPIAGKAMEPKVEERVLSITGMPERVQRAFARATAEELAEYMAMGAEGTIFGDNSLAAEAARDVFLDILEKQQYKDMVPRLLPVTDFYEEELPESVRVFNKTGFDGPTRADAGIIQMGDRKFSYGFITNLGEDTSYRPEQEASILMGKVGKAFWETIN